MEMSKYTLLVTSAVHSRGVSGVAHPESAASAAGATAAAAAAAADPMRVARREVEVTTRASPSADDDDDDDDAASHVTICFFWRTEDALSCARCCVVSRLS